MVSSVFNDILRPQVSDAEGVNAPQMPPSWTETGYNPASLLDIATLESAIVAQLQSYLAAVLGPQMIEVTHFPDKPEAYEMRHRIGTAMVIYNGSEFARIDDTGHVTQERTLEFAVGIRIRDLGWAYGGPPSGTSPGAYQVIEAVRMALLGFIPAPGCTRMKAVREHFVDRDRQGGVWVYESVFSTRTVVVENYETPNYPPFIHGTAQEEGGVTAIQVGVALQTFSGSPGVIALGQGNISAVAVKSQDLATTYVLGADYSLDTVNGGITRLTGGGIAANATVAVSYAYSDVVTALASGGSVPFAPNN
jgi:hypothetical protein